MSEVTQILGRAQRGDPTAAEELLPLVYEEGQIVVLVIGDRIAARFRLEHGG